MKTPAALTLLALFCLGSPRAVVAQPYVPPTSPRATYNFNPGWKLFVGDPAGAHTNGFDDSAWKSVTLPHAWNEDDAFRVFISALPTGTAWYRKHFVLPPGSAGQKVFLEFEGIRHGGEFYINGQFLGRHENGVMAAGFDATPFALPYPQENVVAVRINNSYSYAEVATGLTYQWNSASFYPSYGGINKNVKLHLFGKVYQTLPLFSNLGTVGTYIYAQNFSIPGKSATIHAESQVRNEQPTARTLNYEVVLADMNGLLVTNFTSGSITVQPGQTNTLTATALVTNLNFWSWGYGYLYDVYTIVKETNTVVDVVHTRTGFRKTEFTDGMVRLNDRAIQIRGYAQRTTDEWPAIGQSVPAWLSDFSQQVVVEAGGNTMRWMHVTPSKQTVESCDRVGLMQAMPAGDSENGAVADPQWNQRKNLMRDAIIYHRNNPSIIFYESGNDGISDSRMAEMRAIRDQYDPFGGRAAGCREMMGSSIAEYGGEMLYINKSTTKPMWMMEYSRDEGLRKYWDDYSPPYHADGSGSSFNGTSPANSYNRNQDSHAIEDVKVWFDYYEMRPGTGTRLNAGGVNIIFSDSNSHCRGVQNYRRSGEVDAMRIPKDNYWAHQVMWDGWVDIEQTRAHLIGHWNYTNGTVKNIYAVSSAASAELFLNGQSLGFGAQTYRFLYTWNNVTWASGTLKVVGYDAAGVQSCEDERITTGEPAALRLTSMTNSTGWKSDGHDLAMYEVEVVDSLGRRCPIATDLIDFTLSGPAEWRGGIGIRSDSAPDDNYILSTNLPVACGVNRVFVRSTTNAGTITLVASAPGLTSDTEILTTIPFAVTNGLSTLLPGAGLPSYLARGLTPATPSYQVSRVAIGVSNIIAGAASSTLTNSIDDNETTSWTSSSTLGQNWIQYTLVRTALVSQVVVKFLSPPRNGIYPLTLQVNGVTLYTGTTPATSGYFTFHLTPTLGNTVRISRTTSGSFPIMEAEFYEAVVTGDPPAAPTGLIATPFSSTQINLAWTDNATNESGFKIDRSLDGNNFNEIAAPALNATNYADTGLAPDTTYYYRVRAANPAGDSTNAIANAATLAGPPATPTGLTATPGDAQVALVWNASGGATNYVLQQSTTNGGPYATIATTSATSFVNTNLLNGTNYYYVVAAVGTYGPSPFSPQVSATPNPGISGIYWINTITAAPQSWNANSNWSNGTGFPNGLDASAVVNSSIPANQTINLNQPITLRSLSVGAAGGAFNITGNGGGLTFDNTPDQSVLRQLATSSTNTISAPILNISGLEIVNESAIPLTVSGLLSSGSDVTVNGNVILSGVNTFNGDTFVTNGPLQLANPLALQNSTLNYDNGSLVFNGITAATLGGLAGANSAQNLILNNAASAPVALTVGGNNATRNYGGQLSGSGSLIKIGTGTLTLSNATYTGSTTVNAASGNVTVAGGSFGSPTATVTVGLANGLSVTGGTATAGNVNIGLVGGQTGASASLAGTASATFSALIMGSSGNTAGNFTVNTMGAVSLGSVAVRRNAGAVTTPTTTAGLIIANGTVSAASVTIAQAGVGGRGADLNITGGSLTIADAASTGKFAVNSSAGNGFVTLSGGALTYLGTDGLLMSVGTGVSRISIRGGTATLSGITLNAGNSAGVTSSLVVSNGGTLYLGGVGLVLNQPGATVFASLGNGGATVGAIADWSSIAPITLNGDTTFKAADASSVARNISLGGVLSGTGGLTKTGAGTLTLSGTNTFTGATTVSAGKLLVSGSLAAASAVTVGNGGALGGTGTINGPVTVQSGSTLSPGASIGTLTFSNSLTLAAGSTNFFEITKSPLTNDVARIIGALTNGGTLIVTNIGGAALAAGDSFKLFHAAGYNGSFSAFVLPSLPNTLGWDTSTVNTDGTLRVIAATPPLINSYALPGDGSFRLTFSGMAGKAYEIRASTNLALTPITNWMLLDSGVFGGSAIVFEDLQATNFGQRFYLIRIP